LPTPYEDLSPGQFKTSASTVSAQASASWLPMPQLVGLS
jgi:hypothetical protein